MSGGADVDLGRVLYERMAAMHGWTAGYSSWSREVRRDYGEYAAAVVAAAGCDPGVVAALVGAARAVAALDWSDDGWDEDGAGLVAALRAALAPFGTIPDET